MDEEKLKLWISSYFDMKITDETIFLKDIPFAGFDLYCFFTDFVDKFQIDYQLFNLSDYTLEGVSLFEIWFKGRKANTFDVEHLLKVIKLKKWYDPDEIDNFL